MWSLFVALLTFGIMQMFRMPLWLMLVTVIPVLTILLVMGSVFYNFRKSLKFQDVPTYGYAPRLKELDREAARLEPLGFVKIDQFYFKTIPDSITYAFTHQQEPFYYCIYHLGPKATYELVSLFADNFTLTTSCTVDAGLTPRPARALLQIFPRGSYELLLNKHRTAHQYLVNNGIHSLAINQREFRSIFLKNFLEHAAYIKQMFLWPITLIVRVFTKPGRKYCRTIQEQYPEGFPQG